MKILFSDNFSNPGKIFKYRSCRTLRTHNAEIEIVRDRNFGRVLIVRRQGNGDGN